MEPLTLQTIANFAAGCVRQGDPAQVASGIATDSRTLQQDELFLALQGDNYDGHQFIQTAMERGAIGAIVGQGFTRSSPVESSVIEVADTLKAYQNIAARYRKTLSAKVVAITGSNGKTSAKDLTAAVLSSRWRVLKTMGNYNNHIGVPQTLLRAGAADEVIVLEIGMNHPGEIAPLAAIARPDVAVITSIGTAHIEFMGSRAAIADEKGALAEALDSTGHLVLPEESEYTARISKRTSATKVTVGFQRGDIRAENMRVNGTGTRFIIAAGSERVEAHLLIPGKHMVLNALLAASVGRIYGLSLEECANRLAGAALTKGRLELKNVGSLKILDDSYNANPDSMIAALETLARMPISGRRIAVLGEMGELGRESEAGHRRVGESAGHEKIDQLLAVGSGAEWIVEGAKAAGLDQTLAFPTVQAAAAWLNDFARPDDLILIKGSRSAAMERVINLLASAEPIGAKL